MFYKYWPELVQQGFVKHFITPILKLTPKNRCRCKKNCKCNILFFSQNDFNNKIETLDMKKYNVKYYKGLGTSKTSEALEYFDNMDLHEKEFIDDNKLDYYTSLCFDKDESDSWKKWLAEETKEGCHINYNLKQISFEDFFEYEFKEYSRYDCKRSIPGLDGFKVS